MGHLGFPPHPRLWWFDFAHHPESVEGRDLRLNPAKHAYASPPRGEENEILPHSRLWRDGRELQGGCKDYGRSQHPQPGLSCLWHDQPRPICDCGRARCPASRLFVCLTDRAGVQPPPEPVLVFKDIIPNSSVNLSSKGYFKSSIFLDWLKSPA